MAQTETTSVTTIPSAAPRGVIYVPVVRYNGEWLIPEIALADTVRTTLVRDIATAQHENVSRVLAVDLVAGRGWDASREIAGDVLVELIRERDGVDGPARDFLEKHLGVRAVREAEFYDAA